MRFTELNVFKLVSTSDTQAFVRWSQNAFVPALKKLNFAENDSSQVDAQEESNRNAINKIKNGRKLHPLRSNLFFGHIFRAHGSAQQQI